MIGSVTAISLAFSAAICRQASRAICLRLCRSELLCGLFFLAALLFSRDAMLGQDSGRRHRAAAATSQRR